MRDRMLQRCLGWDYRSRCIYMVTLTAFEHRPIFGRLVGGEAKPEIRKSALGEIVARCWAEIPKRYPGIELLEAVVMPDHFHGVLFVREEQEKPLGAIVGFLKAHSTSLFLRSASASGQDKRAEVPFSAACGGRIWEPGYHDRILFRRGQLARMLDYVRDNPRRLAVKQAHPELFRVVRGLSLGGHSFSAIGNHFLLERPVCTVIQCSRRISPEALEKQKRDLLEAARNCPVLISPCVSPGEKEIARAALEAKLPLVVLLENGFPPIYKPPKRYFEACAEGRLLMLAPWAHHVEKRIITREQCLTLNAFAKQFATNEE